MKDIAVRVGMAANSIVVVLRRNGIDRPAKPQTRWRGAPDRSVDIIALWEKGLCVTQIAERIGVSKYTVDNAIRASGVRKGKPARFRYDSAVGGGSGASGFAGSMARRT